MGFICKTRRPKYTATYRSNGQFYTEKTIKFRKLYPKITVNSIGNLVEILQHKLVCPLVQKLLVVAQTVSELHRDSIDFPECSLAQLRLLA